MGLAFTVDLGVPFSNQPATRVLLRLWLSLPPHSPIKRQKTKTNLHSFIFHCVPNVYTPKTVSKEILWNFQILKYFKDLKLGQALQKMIIHTSFQQDYTLIYITILISRPGISLCVTGYRVLVCAPKVGTGYFQQGSRNQHHKAYRDK